MKIFLAALFISMHTFAFSATYTLSELGLKIDIPSGWIVKETPFSIDASGPAGKQKISINLNFVLSPKTFMEKDMLKELERFCAAAAGTNIGVIDSGRVTFMGLSALFAGYRYTAPGGVKHCAVTYAFDTKAGKAQVTVDSRMDALYGAGFSLEDIVKSLASVTGGGGYSPKSQEMYFYTANLKMTVPSEWKPAMAGGKITGTTKQGVKWAFEVYPESVFEMKSQFQITALLKKTASERYGKDLKYFGESAIGGKGMTFAALHFSTPNNKLNCMYYLIDTGLNTFLFSTEAAGSEFVMSSKEIEMLLKSFKPLTDW
ncbi:MAG: hypothetical protein A2014_01850 [Spirochaetes bacterium GWF1_49_6]|nr:MAG: hypothetical protein A2014_01850 [Spirochaetes bacterium GWF1_49_6]